MVGLTSELLDIKATPVFYANLKAYQSRKHPVIVNEGGSRSSKSYSLMQLMVYICLNEPGKRISVVSHSLPHVRRGVYRDFRAIMESWRQWSDNNWYATEFVYYFNNGSYLELIGLDDESRARGPGRDILWLNESNLIKQATYQQLAMRTTGQIFADLNPADFNNYWYAIADDPRNKKIHSTYKHNLPNLSTVQVELLEGYKNLPDPFLYEVYCLGLRGASEEIIYRGWQLVDDLPGKGEVIYGLDFGYTNPSAFVRVEIYDGDLYAEELVYKSGLTKPELNDLIKTFDTGAKYIYADAAEPDSIEELRRMGLNIHPSNKDVWNGILTVKSKRLFIKRTSVNLIRELQSYKWKKDKMDNILEEPVKENDHLSDALRYAVHSYFSKPQMVFEWF